MNTRGTALTLGLLVVASAGAAALAGATAPAKNGQIAFVRVDLGRGVQSSEIFVANADGTGEHQVTQPPSGFRDDAPDWSPDGSRIVFHRCDANGGRCLIWSTSPAGTDEKLLSAPCSTAAAAPPCFHDVNPAYSPNGRQIVFTHDFGPSLMVADAALKHVREVTLPLPETTAYAAAWSPNGKQLAVAVMKDFIVSRSGVPLNIAAVYVVSADGTAARRLTPWSLDAGGRPDWSPDGKRILFRSNTTRRGGFGTNLYTVRPDGGGLRQLTHATSSDRVLDGVFSPDGTSIAFPTSMGATRAVGQPDIVVMRLDGTGLTPVTRSANWDAEPDWGRAEAAK